MKELPCDSLIREARAILCFITKALAAYELAGVDDYRQIFFDGTKRRGTPIENVIIGYQSEFGFRSVVLSGCVIPEDESAEACADTIPTTIQEGRMLLQR